MSFGAAASSGGFVRPSSEDPCPCGAGSYGGCCAPLLAGDPAPTAERLMRSRYTAFAVGNVDHLRRTWHPQTRPADLALDPTTRWTGLAVLSVDGGTAADQEGSVEFRAGWVVGDARGALQERSRFVRRGGRWVYLDGEVRGNTGEAGRDASV